MSNINITIRYGGETHEISTQDDIVLDDLLQQMAGQGRLPTNMAWAVTKKEGNLALQLDKTLADNKVVDGDILYLALPTKGGSTQI